MVPYQILQFFFAHFTRDTDVVHACMDMCINVFYMFLPIVYLAYKKHNYLSFSILLLLRLLIIQPSVPKTLISHESSFVFPPLYFKFILMQLYYIKSAFTSKHCYKCFFSYSSRGRFWSRKHDQMYPRTAQGS